MYKFVSFLKEFNIPTKKEILAAIASFSKKELNILYVLSFISIVTMLIILNSLNNKFLVDVPIKGGSIVEGIIGMPTLVNPVLATSQADKDLVQLVYSGLMRKLPDGTIIPDIAESYSVSTDGLTYTFIIKKNLKFHDGKKITADDIIFTINKIKDTAIKSPQKLEWDGITINKIDDHNISFSLKQPYISFLDITTIGILPLHIWENIKGDDFNLSTFNNIKAVGSGPYKIYTVEKNNDGIPNKYILNKFSGFSLGNPNIKKITILSFSNEKELISALLNQTIDQAGGLSPANSSVTKKELNTINTSSVPRIFGLFYNGSVNKIFLDKNVINAIEYAIDKQEIIDDVLYGYGSIISNPIQNNLLDSPNSIIINNIEKANTLLDKAGWKIGEDGFRYKGGVTTVDKTKKVGKKLIVQKVTVNNGPLVKLEFSITTGDTPELKRVVELIKIQLEKIGISVNIDKVYEMGPLNQVIQNREYEALFFGQITKHESDLFSYWHSSQKKGPGLNIAMYSNIKIDKILEDLQKTLDREKRISKYLEFIDIFENDKPALLIYSPKYLYVTSKNLNNLNINTITNPSDRFASVYSWYANKDRVWKIFRK